MMSCSVYKKGRVGQGLGITAWGQARHQSARGEQLLCASLILYLYFVLFFSSSFAILLNCLYLNLRVLFFFFLFCFPSHWGWGEGVSKQLCGA